MDKTLNHIPIYSILLIFSSYVSLAYFYDGFGVEIFNYVEITDLILITLPVLKTIFIGSIFTLLVLFVGFILGFGNSIIHSAFIESAYSDLRKKEGEQVISETTDYNTEAKEVNIISIAKKVLKPDLKAPSKRFMYLVDLVRLIGTMSALIALFYVGVSQYIEAIKEIQNGSMNFYNNPYEKISFLILSPFFIVITTAIIFGGTRFMRWASKRKVKPHLLIYAVIAFFTLFSVLLNHALSLRIKKGETTNSYAIYMKDKAIKCPEDGYKMIGRVRNYVFMLKGDQVKSINISEADSIVQRPLPKLKSSLKKTKQVK